MTHGLSRAKRLSEKWADTPERAAFLVSAPSQYTTGRLYRISGPVRSQPSPWLASGICARTFTAGVLIGRNSKRRGKRMPSQAPVMPAAQRKWTDEQRETVKALLAKGATAAVVAREMGIGRNQALGRIYRDPDLALRKYPRKPKAPRPPRPPRPRKEKTAIQTPAVADMVAPAGDVVHSEPAALAPSPEPPTHPNPMALIGTGTRWCKWPVAADSRVLGGFLCCGDRSLPGDVYCSTHRKISARPPKDGGQQ